MIKRIASVVLVSIMLLAFTSCEYGMNIVKVELGSLPDNIVYYVGESTGVDLSGATIITTIGDGRSFNEPIDKDNFLEIIDNVNFSVPGVYEVEIRRQVGGDRNNDNLVGRIPIQVVERD